MESRSSVRFFDGGAEIARSFTDSLGLRLGQFSGWLRDKSRQIRSFPGNEELIRAVLSTERVPVEGVRFRIGERINIYQPDGEYRRLKICGVRSGGFSNVYTVIDLDEMRPYCLKESRALPGEENEKNKKLAIEATISLRLGAHPHLLTTYGAFVFRSRLLILTEYLSGTSLDQHLKNGPLPITNALAYAVQLSSAIQRARDILPGFVHGDIKPGNCLIASTGELKLGDFGLASADGVASYLDRSGKPDNWGGTTAYMAPEMFDARAPDRCNADIYAFGVTLFEMLTGQQPFTASSKRAMIEMHRNAEPPVDLLRTNGIPRTIMELVAECLTKSSSERPRSFESVKNRLSRTLWDEFEISTPSCSVQEFTNPEIVGRALSCAALGDNDTATSYFDSIVRRSDASAEMHAGKAMTLLLGARFDDAYQSSTAALMANPRSFMVLFVHGRTLEALGDLDNAEKYFLRALRLEPGNCVALNKLGSLYIATGQYDEAAILFERSRKLDPTQVEPLEGIAITKLLSGNVQTGIGLFKQALSIDPHNAGIHGHLGDAYRKVGSLVAAISAYNHALRLGLDSKATARGFVRSCVEHYQREGHIGNGGFVKSLIRATRIQSKVNDPDAVRDFATEFISLLVENDLEPLLCFYFDGALTLVADRLATPVLEKLIATVRGLSERPAIRSVSGYTLESVGRVLYYLGEYGTCMTVFELMLGKVGPNEHSYYYLAACCEINTNYRESLNYYKKALRFEDSEEAQTGFRRVTARIKQIESTSPNLVCEPRLLSLR